MKLGLFLSGVIETAQEAVEISRSITTIREEDLKMINAISGTSENALVIYEGLIIR